VGGHEDDKLHVSGGAMARMVATPPGAPSAKHTAQMPVARARIAAGPAVTPAAGTVDAARYTPDALVSTAAIAPQVHSPRDLAWQQPDGVDRRSPSRTIGRFELIREIARGGMGQVFLGRDTKLGRKVAVKFLLRDDPHFVQRFLIEARATARCAHENIVTIYEVGEHEGLPYMVLELLEGKTLSDVLEGKPSVTQIVELMIPVIRALERAHGHGIVHRDLKPSNVFVTDRGHVKVLDFGVARITNKDEAEAEIARVTAAMQAVTAPDEISSSTFTGSNSLVGTLPYMSPEQWGTDRVDQLSDIWAVGIIFWRALVGAHPAGTVQPDKLQVRTCDLDMPFPSVATRDPTLPPELVAIVDRCLAKRKRDRYRSATELLGDLGRLFAPKAVTAADEDCPYRGLAAFAEHDAKFFFGRSNEIRSAVAQLDTWPVLAVIGASGVGKSSFIHAGLVPAIRKRGGNWHVCNLRPGRTPLDRLAAMVEGLIADRFQPGEFQQGLLESPGSLGVVLRRAAAQRGQALVLVIDQLEELFTLCEYETIRRVFVAAVLGAADDTSTPVRVVMSMRADFLDRLVAYKEHLTDLSRGQFFLTAPDRENLRETIIRPAELGGYAFEDAEVIEHMLQVATSRGALSMLSFSATRLWQARDRQRRVLTVAAYNDMGGVGGAFAQHADQVASAVPPQSQLLLRAIMTRLVTPEGTRAVVELHELLTLAADQRDVENILDHLARARLVQLHTDGDHASTVEIVHEMLITEWPTLRRWLDDSHALRGFLHELRQAARQWTSRGKPRDLVWRGATARDALGHAERQLLDLSASEAEFLQAIRDELARSRRRRVLLAATSLSVLALVLAGGGFALVKIKLAEQQAQYEKLEALSARREAEIDRAAALEAKADLQRQYDIIAEKERQRQLAEEQALAANRSQEMTKEQLAETNRILERKVAEAQAAQEKALSSEALARRASDEARAAKRQVERMLEQERAAHAKLKAAKKDIIDGDLNAVGGGR
jgi:eukaryotic-like serine/threonine-protein kinase